MGSDSVEQKSAKKKRSRMPRSTAMRFVLLIGVVSLFADMTHEGARSITGPFLATLGASAFVVGAVAGFGELAGYALRFLFGYAADRTGRYWPLTFLGYGIQMLAVPLLALAGNWPVAALLMIAERSGRAMRNPARDAMLAHTAVELGGGRVFGLREALDATGGMLGPLIVAAVIAIQGVSSSSGNHQYRVSFAVLLVPAVLTLVVLFLAQRLYPHPHNLEASQGSLQETLHAVQSRRFPAVFWIYLAGMALVAAAYADYPLIAYHFQKTGVIASTWIPLLYALAMGTEAIAALVLGRLFDRVGLATVVGATLVTAFFAPLVFLGGPPLIVIGMIIWGMGMAAQESVVKAAVTRMVAANRRATAYGLFDTGFGVFWFLGSVLLGVLYDWNIIALVVFSMLSQLVAVPVLYFARRRLP
jgi:MFS family permease